MRETTCKETATDLLNDKLPQLANHSLAIWLLSH